ncbi:MAG: hypothetical protein HY807_12165 [Nitrospirae bacterium]|nr:hypothetical protein [Nitrospirota bacterium]
MSFVIRGSLAWETDKNDTKVMSPTKYIWLQSDYYDSKGKPFFANPLKTYSQRELNQYDIWGGISIQVDRQNVQSTKDTLEQGFRDISLCCNLASLLTRSSVTWFPARYVEVKNHHNPDQSEPSTNTRWMCLPLSRQQEERTSVRVKDDFIEKDLFPLFEIIRLAHHHETAALLRRSIAWHSTGNFLGVGLSRYLNYWESVELLAHYFYYKFPPKIVKRPTKADRRANILNILTKQTITQSNCLELAAECANQT